MSEKSLEERVHALESRDAMYGPITLGGPCRICGRPNHGPMTCAQAEAQEHAAVVRLVAAIKGKFPTELLEGG